MKKEQSLNSQCLEGLSKSRTPPKDKELKLKSSPTINETVEYLQNAKDVGYIPKAINNGRTAKLIRNLNLVFGLMKKGQVKMINCESRNHALRVHSKIKYYLPIKNDTFKIALRDWDIYVERLKE